MQGCSTIELRASFHLFFMSHTITPGRDAWIFKSEPEEYSFDMLLRDGQSPWTGIRNYQARNFMRDDIQVGDPVLFYHSSTAIPGIVGLAVVTKGYEPDPTQFDATDHYFDPTSTPTNPRWGLVTLTGIAALPRHITLQELREDEITSTLTVCMRGSRLSISRVPEQVYQHILKTAGYDR
jgi:predicted RNA-binding protein with PUA-like domain